MVWGGPWDSWPSWRRCGRGGVREDSPPSIVVHSLWEGTEGGSALSRCCSITVSPPQRYMYGLSRCFPGEPGALWPVATLAAVVLEFLWHQFLFWLVVLPRLLAHVSPKGESVLGRGRRVGWSSQHALLLTLCTCSWGVWRTCITPLSAMVITPL